MPYIAEIDYRTLAVRRTTSITYHDLFMLYGECEPQSRELIDSLREIGVEYRPINFISSQRNNSQLTRAVRELVDEYSLPSRPTGIFFAITFDIDPATLTRRELGEAKKAIIEPAETRIF